MWELLRNLALSALGLFALFNLGPPVVDLYYLPTIQYVAGTFNAIAPRPPPPTTFVQMQTPMVAVHGSTVPNTVFVEQAYYGRPEGAMITGVNDGQWPFYIPHNSSESASQANPDMSSSQRDGLSHGLSAFSEWCSRIIREATRVILLHLCQLFDNFLYQVQLLTAIIISWKLLKYRSQLKMKRITRMHQMDLIAIQQELDALSVIKDTQIASLNTQKQLLETRLDEQNSLLEEAKEETNTKTLAEEKFRSDIAELKSSLQNKDSIIAERDKNLAETIKRADSTESANMALKKKAKQNRSDFDSASQKKQNELDTQNRALEQVTKHEKAARHELKEARVQTGKDRKTISELETRVTDSTKEIGNLKAQVKEKDASIARKDGAMTSMREERKKVDKTVKDMTVEKDRALKNERETKAKDAKVINELQAEVQKVDNIRRLAETKAAEQEALASESIEQRTLANEAVVQQAIREAEAEAEAELAAVRAELVYEKAAKFDAQQERQEAEERVEVLMGEIADLLEHDNAQKKELHHVEDGGAGGDEEENADAPVSFQNGSGKSQPNRKKLRSNKREDGSINTSKHPGYHSSEQRGTDGRRICKFFRKGNCKYGADCRDAHEASASADTPAKPTLQAPAPASVQQADRHHPYRPTDPKPLRPTCKLFQQGYCRFGIKCRDFHDLSTRSRQPADRT